MAMALPNPATRMAMPSRRSRRGGGSCTPLIGTIIRDVIRLVQALVDLPQTPERSFESNAREESLGFLDRPPAPGGISPIVFVPGLCQPPALLDRENSAACKVPVTAPLVDVLFRNEEQHGLSREDDVVPPTVRWNAKMNQPASGLESAAYDVDAELRAAARAGGGNPGVAVEHGGNSERIPDAIAVAGKRTHLYGERRRNGRKGARHEDFAARLQDEDVSLGQALKGRLDVRP